MSISFNPVNMLNHATSMSSKTMEKIATGSSHPNASYGASDYANAQRMKVNINSVHQANQNTQNSNAMLATASGAINNTVQSLTSLKESLINAANGTNGASDITTIQNSINQTVSQINENANVEYNGQKLLTGGVSTSVAGPDGMAKTIDFGNMTSTGLGLTDSQGNSTLDLSSSTGIANAINTVDNALNSALDKATTIGAAQEGLDYQSANYTVSEENAIDSMSTLDDANMAEEITKMRSQDTQAQLALFANKMYNHNQANVLALLK